MWFLFNRVRVALVSTGVIRNLRILRMTGRLRLRVCLLGCQPICDLLNVGQIALPELGNASIRVVVNKHRGS